MTITQNVTLDVNQVSVFSYLNAKQGDSGRRLRVKVTVDGKPYKVPSTATVSIRTIRPDDFVFTSDGSVNTDGTVNVRLYGNECLSVTGKVFADISISYSGIVSTVSFIVVVRDLPGGTSKIGASTYDTYNNLVTLVSGLSSYDSTLTSLKNNKADGPGLTVSLSDDILTVQK